MKREIDNTLALMAGADALGKPPRAIISLHAWHKIRTYVNLMPYEISGWAFVDTHPNGIFVIRDPYILKQVTNKNGSAVEEDEWDANQFESEMAEQGISTANVRLQWHSHVHSDPFWSLHADLPDCIIPNMAVNDWMMFLVLNKRGEYKLRLDVSTPHPLSVNMPLEILTPWLPGSDIARIADDIKSKVRVKRIIGSTAVKVDEQSTAISDVGVFSPDDILTTGEEHAMPEVELDEQEESSNEETDDLEG